MAWPALTADDVRSGAGAKTLGRDLYDREAIAVTRRTTWYFTEVNFTTTLADVNTQAWRVPPWALTGAVIKIIVRAKRAGAVSGNASFRLRETGGPTNGTTIVTALTTSYAYYELDLTVPDGTWASALKTLAVQAQRPASGADADWFIECDNMGSNLQFGAV